MIPCENKFKLSKNPKDFARGYLEYLGEIMARLDLDQIASFMDVLLQSRQRGARIFFMGNGGSAATASHFANDIAIGTQSRLRPFRAMSLCDNLAVMTALANDHGYDQIFVRQLENLMDQGDVVVAISASGNSGNLLQAIEYANTHGGVTVGLTGFDGGKLGKMAQYQVHVPSNKGEYGPVEDIHMVLDHLVGAYLMLKVREES